MDSNNGKPLSPWKAPSRISLKRIRHKINSDISVSPSLSSTIEKNSQKQNGKRNRIVINKFALARSTSTSIADENVTPIISEKLNSNEHLLARLHQIMPTQSSNDIYLDKTYKSFSFDETFNNSESSKHKIQIKILKLIFRYFSCLGKISEEIISSFPNDWSIKSSCRFHSLNLSLFLNNFLKLRSIDESLALEYICSNTPQNNEKALFRSLTSYWTYPHISWLRLFPRTQQQQTHGNFLSLDEQAQTTLQDEWKIAFQSLFQAFRTKFISFFYMCTHTFNVLFREDPSSQIIAIITPTTSGFRSTLEREGIEFTMAG